ncbi:succinate dehydrogenase [ubiquinone] cytochrome b small subunit, mitochondrial-like [Mytilus californianus]|uniref:succinate dehydrogenase [ubiquinone] cytochrome b small subunit, mitochondrial-like n=1 Tax=Mytilus californianus TaxID=6549 RepID=UPI0022453ED8|nr:succinate dehydrogenase [ubiquinone] cytochrome b small subunit, mitochondrial-like [Mytilus californianus]
MASICLLRSCGGTARRICLRPQIFKELSPNSISKDVTSKTIVLSPAMSHYFQARRGPFTPAEKQGKHMMMASTHWKIERIIAVSMLGIMPASIYFQGPFWDFMIASTVMLHGYWGVNGVLTDYLEKFIPFIHWFWYALAMAGVAGLLNFNYNDVGVTKAISLVWKL